MLRFEPRTVFDVSALTGGWLQEDCDGRRGDVGERMAVARPAVEARDTQSGTGENSAAGPRNGLSLLTFRIAGGWV